MKADAYIKARTKGLWISRQLR